jgi:glycosyltransferase involved in cell wall biosynthesis
MILLHRECPVASEVRKHDIAHELVSRRNWAYSEDGKFVRRVASGLYSFGANFFSAGRVLEKTRSFEPDLIHTNSSKTQFGAILAWRIGIPHVWHFREFLGGPYSSGAIFSLGNKLSRRFIEASSSATIFVSKALKQHLSLRDSRVPVHVVYNGIMSSHSMMKTMNTPMPQGETLTLSWIGRFEDYKHPLVAFEAIRILRNEGLDVRLIVAGTGSKDQIQRLEKFITEHQLDNSIEMKGFVEDIDQVYRQSHAMVICTTADACARVIAEAMAYGRPVIGADSCSTSELIEHETNGLLFEPNNAEDLAEQIRRLSDDRDMVARLGANAAEKAKREFTVEKYGDTMERIFLDAVAQHSKMSHK